MRRGPALVLIGSLLLGAAWAGAQSAKTAWHQLQNFNPPPVVQPVADLSPAQTGRVLLLTIEGLTPREARLMPTLQWLAQRGARFTLTAEEPLTPEATFASLVTGAPPTIHGVMLPERTSPLGAETLLGVAGRIRQGATAIGATGALVTSTKLPPAPEARLAALKAVTTSTDALTLVALDDLAVAQKRLGAADPAQAEYGQAIAALDGELLALLEGLDLTKTTLVVAGHLPTGLDGLHHPVDRGVLVAAGPGVQPGAAGEAPLINVAPTVATLLGLPIPGHATGQPILALLDQGARLPDALAAQSMTVRRAALQGALTQVGSQERLPDAPKGAAAAPEYIQSIERYVSQTERFVRVTAWKDRVVGPGIILGIGLLYLLIVTFQPFGRPVWGGVLLYLITVVTLFLLTGGRYRFLGAGLADWGRVALFQLAGIALVGQLIAGTWMGYRLSRKGFKRGDYLALAGLHLNLLLVVLTAIPLLVGWILWGPALPVSLPSLPMVVLLLALVGQVPLLGALSPLTAFWTTFVSRTATQLWPLPEVGDPEENADKVVRLRAIKRTSQQAKRTRKG